MADIRLDSKFLRKLDHLMFRALGVASGDLMGGRRSRRRGVGLEFADHKAYSSGDDFRYLDWNILARLDELFLKVFELEEDLYVYILVDCSKSMDFGDPNKSDFARMLAAALAYIGLAKQDIVRLSFFDSELVTNSNVFKGREQILRVFDFLNDRSTGGRTSFADALSDFVRSTRRHGIVLLISDFLDPGNLKEALRTLVHNRFGVYALHVVDADEETPNLIGDVELTDSETGESLSVSLRGSALEAYRRMFQDHFAELRRFLHSYNARYIRALTSTSLEDLFLMTFRREGLFR